MAFVLGESYSFSWPDCKSGSAGAPRVYVTERRKAKQSKSVILSQVNGSYPGFADSPDRTGNCAISSSER